MKIQVILLPLLLYSDAAYSKPQHQEQDDGTVIKRDPEKKVKEPCGGEGKIESGQDVSSRSVWGRPYHFDASDTVHLNDLQDKSRKEFLEILSRKQSREDSDSKGRNGRKKMRNARSTWESFNSGASPEGVTLNKNGIAKVFKTGQATVAETLNGGAAIRRILAQANAKSDAVKASMYDNKYQKNMFDKFRVFNPFGMSFDADAFTRALYGPPFLHYLPKEEKREQEKKATVDQIFTNPYGTPANSDVQENLLEIEQGSTREGSKDEKSAVPSSPIATANTGREVSSKGISESASSASQRANDDHEIVNTDRSVFSKGSFEYHARDRVEESEESRHSWKSVLPSRYSDESITHYAPVSARSSKAKTDKSPLSTGEHELSRGTEINRKYEPYSPLHPDFPANDDAYDNDKTDEREKHESAASNRGIKDKYLLNDFVHEEPGNKMLEYNANPLWGERIPTDDNEKYQDIIIGQERFFADPRSADSGETSLLEEFDESGYEQRGDKYLSEPNIKLYRGNRGNNNNINENKEYELAGAAPQYIDYGWEGDKDLAGRNFNHNSIPPKKLKNSDEITRYEHHNGLYARYEPMYTGENQYWGYYNSKITADRPDDKGTNKYKKDKVSKVDRSRDNRESKNHDYHYLGRMSGEKMKTHDENDKYENNDGNLWKYWGEDDTPTRVGASVGANEYYHKYRSSPDTQPHGYSEINKEKNAAKYRENISVISAPAEKSYFAEEIRDDIEKHGGIENSNEKYYGINHQNYEDEYRESVEGAKHDTRKTRKSGLSGTERRDRLLPENGEYPDRHHNRNLDDYKPESEKYGDRRWLHLEDEYAGRKADDKSDAVIQKISGEESSPSKHSERNSDGSISESVGRIGLLKDHDYGEERQKNSNLERAKSRNKLRDKNDVKNDKNEKIRLGSLDAAVNPSSKNSLIKEKYNPWKNQDEDRLHEEKRISNVHQEVGAKKPYGAVYDPKEHKPKESDNWKNSDGNNVEKNKSRKPGAISHQYGKNSNDEHSPKVTESVLDNMEDSRKYSPMKKDRKNMATDENTQSEWAPNNEQHKADLENPETAHDLNEDHVSDVLGIASTETVVSASKKSGKSPTNGGEQRRPGAEENESNLYHKNENILSEDLSIVKKQVIADVTSAEHDYSMVWKRRENSKKSKKSKSQILLVPDILNGERSESIDRSTDTNDVSIVIDKTCKLKSEDDKTQAEDVAAEHDEARKKMLNDSRANKISVTSATGKARARSASNSDENLSSKKQGNEKSRENEDSWRETNPESTRNTDVNKTPTVSRVSNEASEKCSSKELVTENNELYDGNENSTKNENISSENYIMRNENINNIKSVEKETEVPENHDTEKSETHNVLNGNILVDRRRKWKQKSERMYPIGNEENMKRIPERSLTQNTDGNNLRISSDEYDLVENSSVQNFQAQSNDDLSKKNDILWDNTNAGNNIERDYDKSGLHGAKEVSPVLEHNDPKKSAELWVSSGDSQEEQMQKWRHDSTSDEENMKHQEKSGLSKSTDESSVLYIRDDYNPMEKVSIQKTETQSNSRSSVEINNISVEDKKLRDKDKKDIKNVEEVSVLKQDSKKSGKFWVSKDDSLENQGHKWQHNPASDEEMHGYENEENVKTHSKRRLDNANDSQSWVESDSIENSSSPNSEVQSGENISLSDASAASDRGKNYHTYIIRDVPKGITENNIYDVKKSKKHWVPKGSFLENRRNKWKHNPTGKEEMYHYGNEENVNHKAKEGIADDTGGYQTSSGVVPSGKIGNTIDKEENTSSQRGDNIRDKISERKPNDNVDRSAERTHYPWLKWKGSDRIGKNKILQKNLHKRKPMTLRHETAKHSGVPEEYGTNSRRNKLPHKNPEKYRSRYQKLTQSKDISDSKELYEPVPRHAPDSNEHPEHTETPNLHQSKIKELSKPYFINDLKEDYKMHHLTSKKSAKKVPLTAIINLLRGTGRTSKSEFATDSSRSEEMQDTHENSNSITIPKTNSVEDQAYRGDNTHLTHANKNEHEEDQVATDAVTLMPDTAAKAGENEYSLIHSNQEKEITEETEKHQDALYIKKEEKLRDKELDLSEDEASDILSFETIRATGSIAKDARNNASSSETESSVTTNAELNKYNEWWESEEERELIRETLPEKRTDYQKKEEPILEDNSKKYTKTSEKSGNVNRNEMSSRIIETRQFMRIDEKEENSSKLKNKSYERDDDRENDKILDTEKDQVTNVSGAKVKTNAAVKLDENTLEESALKNDAKDIIVEQERNLVSTNPSREDSQQENDLGASNNGDKRETTDTSSVEADRNSDSLISGKLKPKLPEDDINSRYHPDIGAVGNKYASQWRPVVKVERPEDETRLGKFEESRPPNSADDQAPKEKYERKSALSDGGPLWTNEVNTSDNVRAEDNLDINREPPSGKAVLYNPENNKFNGSPRISLSSDESPRIKTHKAISNPLNKQEKNFDDSPDKTGANVKSSSNSAPYFPQRKLSSSSTEEISDNEFASEEQPSLQKFVKPTTEISYESKPLPLPSMGSFESTPDEEESRRITAVNSQSPISPTKVLKSVAINDDLHATSTSVTSSELPHEDIKSTKVSDIYGDVSADVKDSNVVNERSRTAENLDNSDGLTGGFGCTLEENLAKSKTDIYVVKKNSKGPIKVIHLMDTQPPRISYRILSKEVYEKIMDAQIKILHV